MDLIRTLMVYMMVLMGSAVEALPNATPIPPSAIPTATAYVTQAPTYTPVPTIVPTATPSPTPAYTTLYVGDRGSDVRKMQTRLIELGYLPAGSADGVFGPATKRAVQRFQTYNNLTVDGIAGARTLRKLYEDKTAVIAPVDITPSPTAPGQITAQVTVDYKTNTGILLYRDSIICTYTGGYTSISANPARVPSGYALVSQSPVTVLVNTNGTASPNTVTFLYAASATAAPTSIPSVRVPVYYVTDTGRQLSVDYVNCSYTGGYSYITANDSLVPKGYLLASARTVSVYVNEYGKADPAAVSFTYRTGATATPQASVDVPVYYMSDSNQLLSTTHVTCYAGQSNTIQANDALVPAGYTLVSARTVSVSVSATGTATPKTVTFTYRAPASPTAAPVRADVSVRFQTTEGETVASPITYTLDEGTSPVYAEPFDLAAGFSLTSVSPQYVKVDALGAHPSVVTFIYAPSTPLTADVTIRYRDTYGADVASAQSVKLENGVHVLYASPDNLAGGYKLTGEDNAKVTVRDGIATPGEIVFTYVQTQVSYDVTVRYQDESGTDIASAQTVTVSMGDNTVRAEPVGLSDGWTLTGKATVIITVDENGPSQNTVIFTYRNTSSSPQVSAIKNSSIIKGDGTPVGALTLYTASDVSRPLVPLRAFLTEMGYHDGTWNNGFTATLDGVTFAVTASGNTAEILYGFSMLDMSQFDCVVENDEIYISWNIFEHILAVVPKLTDNTLMLIF